MITLRKEGECDLCDIIKITSWFLCFYRVNIGLGTIKGGFRGLHYVFGVLVAKNLLVFGLFYAVRLWAVVRFTLMESKYTISISYIKSG